MSWKSSVAVKLGLTPSSLLSLLSHRFLFSINNALDTNNDRKYILKVISDYTHVSYKRLKFLWDTAEKCHVNHLEGAFVETGVWKGGCAGILAHISKKYNYEFPLYFFDSFEGLPQPTPKDGQDAIALAGGKAAGELQSISQVYAGESYINELLLDRLNIDHQKVHIVKGWFQDTLPIYKNSINKIALLRMDGDWYDSTLVALENFYNNVVSGGYILIDDYYYWDGCKQAVKDFLRKNNLDPVIKRQDASGAYWVKNV